MQIEACEAPGRAEMNRRRFGRSSTSTEPRPASAWNAPTAASATSSPDEKPSPSNEARCRQRARSGRAAKARPRRTHSEASRSGWPFADPDGSAAIRCSPSNRASWPRRCRTLRRPGCLRPSHQSPWAPSQSIKDAGLTIAGETLPRLQDGSLLGRVRREGPRMRMDLERFAGRTPPITGTRESESVPRAVFSCFLWSAGVVLWDWGLGFGSR
jgi:hypothetical protein